MMEDLASILRRSVKRWPGGEALCFDTNGETLSFAQFDQHLRNDCWWPAVRTTFNRLEAIHHHALETNRVAIIAVGNFAGLTTHFQAIADMLRRRPNISSGEGRQRSH